MNRNCPGIAMVIFLALCSILGACSFTIDDLDPLITENVGRREQFYVERSDNGKMYQIDAVVLAENSLCIIYAESDTQGNPRNGVTRNIAEQIAGEYSYNIHNKITAAFGDIKHVTPQSKPGYGKVSFLLTDIKDGYTGSGGYVAGFFHPKDMLVTGSYSNRRDMLYIDTDPGLKDKRGLYAVMAHELQHLINYSNTVAKTGREMDLWINEGLSTAAEYLYDGDPCYRVSYYNKDSEETIVRGNNFFVWNGTWDDDPLADYATAYLFFQWLRLHAANGQGIYREIIATAASGDADYRAVVRTAKNRIPALGLRDEKDWVTLIRSWHLANLLYRPSGVYGYKDQISSITRGQEEELALWYFANTRKDDMDFYPGEGVVSRLSAASYTPSKGGSNIKYVGVPLNGNIITTPPYSGNFLLTFNANTSKSGAKERGFLASVVPAASAAHNAVNAGVLPARRSGAHTALPRSYPIDARILFERNKRLGNE
jgi:hypothetical protein